MPEALKQLILQFMGTIYPWIEKEAIFLTGSRAIGTWTPTSDIDILVFINPKDYSYYLKQSFEHGFRKEGEEAGLEERFSYEGNEVLLEVKFMTELYLSNLIDYFSYSKMQLINDNHAKHSLLKADLQKWFDQGYEDRLMQHYIQAFQDMKELKDMFKKEQKNLMLDTIFIKKGIFLEAVMKLLYLIKRQGYPTVKWMLPLLDWEEGTWIQEIVSEVKSLATLEEFLIMEEKVKRQINKKLMPQRPYVGQRWKFLSAFKHL